MLEERMSAGVGGGQRARAARAGLSAATNRDVRGRDDVLGRLSARSREPFLGRTYECEVLHGLLEDALAGRGGVLMVQGEAGVGKTVLLEYAIESASELQIARASGVEVEMELPFAAVQQLCSPFCDLMDRLPHPQREALGVAFGHRTGPAPDPLLVGLALLGLLSEAAEEGPLLVVVDDAHWLDQASALALAFVARRVLAEKILLLFGTREIAAAFVRLPSLNVRPLGRRDARALLRSILPVRLDEPVLERIVVETRGNPLALVELPRGLTPSELAGGFGLPATATLSAGIEVSFTRRLEELPEDTRLLLLLAAAEPLGDPLLLWRAAENLEISSDAAAAGVTDGLLEVAEHVAFRHPLVRSAVYRSATADQRRAVHLALAAVTDGARDPDRRAWHLAAAASGPDEAVASELERSAGRAQARGGLAAAAAFLQRSVALTGDAGRRTGRALAAARAHVYAGAFDDALALLPIAEASSSSGLQRAQAELLRGQIAFSSNTGSDAPPLLLSAARHLEPFDVDLARETYLDAWGAAWFAGSMATSGGLREVSEAVVAAPPSADPSRPFDLLLDALALLVTEGRAKAAPELRRASRAFLAAESPADNSFRWTALPPIPSYILWDDEGWHAINARQLGLAREAGALARVPMGLITGAVIDAWSGEFAKAAEATAEASAIVEATGTHLAPYAAMLLGALQGRGAEGLALLETTIRAASAVGQGFAVQWGEFVKAILLNGLGRYEAALDAARRASDDTPELFISSWALVELIEASSRSGSSEHALGALERLTEDTAVAGTEWGLGVAARSRALLTDGDEAELLYCEAIERLGRTRLRPELGRAHLLYGEWLRRQQRRLDARTALRTAHEMFVWIGMEAFADRAARELMATGEHARKRTIETRCDLTPQELEIARLACGGLSNVEISGSLFISRHTVEYHLRKVFAKLGINSRMKLATALPPE
jgi:DNA-binding CsgD family transcriptional regulator/tetratricopeptide (TPR) repeat protein